LFIYDNNKRIKRMTGDVSLLHSYFNNKSNLWYIYVPADEKGFALLKLFEENKFWKNMSNKNLKSKKHNFIDPVLMYYELINI
jgi:hypothetical protein